MVNDWDRKKTNYMLTKLQKRQTIHVTLIFALWKHFMKGIQFHNEIR